MGEHDNATPADLDDPVVQALGKLSEALERIERARGALYDFHQLTGGADAMLDDAVEAFEKAGHPDAADLIRQELIGRDVLDGRWTFQIMEEYEDGYYGAWKETEQTLRERYADGRRHTLEAALKIKRQNM